LIARIKEHLLQGGNDQNPMRVARRETNKAAEASPRRTSGEKSSWVAVMIIFPEESLIIVALIAKESHAATSKLPLEAGAEPTFRL
jgi:hypothetical protein